MRRPGRDDQGIPQRGGGLPVESLVEEHLELVWAIVMSILGDPSRADDAFQETWFRVQDALSRGTTVERPRAWVSTIARRVAFDMLGERFPATLPEEIVSPPTGDPVLRRELSDELRRSLEEIAPEDKEILLRWRLRGESIRALGEEYGMSPSGLWSRIQRTLDRLRRILRPRLEPEI